MRSNILDIEAQFQVKTAQAVCIREHEGSEDDIWLPLSEVQIDADVNDLRRGDIVTITGPEWLFEAKGLI